MEAASPATSAVVPESHSDQAESWLTVHSSAVRANLCDATIRRAINTRNLRAVQIGGRHRIRSIWLNDWLERQARPRVRSEAESQALSDRNRKAVQERWARVRRAAQ
jgi:hypothetical protein